MMTSEILSVVIPQTLFGAGATAKLGELVRDFSPTNILIVTDPGVERAGLVETVKAPLSAAGFKPNVFSKCGVEAPASIIEELRDLIATGKYDLLIGVGGGSVMDTTKAASVLAANSGLTLQDLLEFRPAGASVKKILIPTTSGTGSEWSSAAVVTLDAVDGRTYPYFTPRNYPDAVIIDPELTRNLPARATAHTGMDALTHAIEAYTCCRASVVSDMFAVAAIKLIAESLRPAFAKGSCDMEHRYKLAMAASAAMAAGSVAGVGIAHFMNHGLARKAHTSHGSTVALMLPYVMEFNLVSNPAKFAEVARLLGEETYGLSVMDAAQESAVAVRRLLNDLEMPQTLTEVGVTEADIPELVDELMTYQSFPIAFMNPRDVSAEDAAAIYMSAL
jgi:alcohol dehydrogenase